VKERDTDNIIYPLFRQLFEIYCYFSIFRDQESVDVISRGILEPNISISMSSVESVSDSSHKAGSGEPACFSVLATVQKKYLTT
jgi:hypothetical protein